MMKTLRKYTLKGSNGRIWCHKIEIVIPSYRLGLALREMVKELKLRKMGNWIFISKVNPIIMSPLPNVSMPLELKSFFPLRRDSKTGRMMKAEKV